MPWIDANSNLGDALTGDRVFPGERVFDTGFRNVRTPWLTRGKTRVVKEETLVKVLEDAGYVVKRDAGDSGDAEVVDGADVSVGGGEDPVGEVPTGGKQASKRRSGGSTKGK